MFLLHHQPEFCSLTHLIKIDLSKNQLVCLPEEIGQLGNLQHLDLYNNKLKVLPVGFSQLKVGVGFHKLLTFSLILEDAIFILGAVVA